MATAQAKKLKNKAKASLALLVIAVISISTATYAWFSLSNSAVVQDMTIQVGTSTALKVSTSFSTDIADYQSILENDDVNALLQTLGATYGADGLAALRLWPLTSYQGTDLFTQSVNSASGTTHTPVDPHTTKAYLDLPLWFMASVDMNVYLNRDSAPDLIQDDGTLVESVSTNTAQQAFVDKAVRVSFDSYGTLGDTLSNSENDYDIQKQTPVIYEPNKNGSTTLKGFVGGGGNATRIQNTFVDLGTNAGTETGNGDDPPVVFQLKGNVPTKVIIRLWIEGYDTECVNGVVVNGQTVNIENAKFNVRLRFCGADDSGIFLETGTVS